MNLRIDKSEVGVSLIKSIISNIPIGGQLLNEVFFEYRGRVKQNRLNQFTELLSKSLSNQVDIDYDKIDSEKFGDLLEAVIRRVVQTRSHQKHVRFKNVLLNELLQPSQEIDDSDIFLDLISVLSDDEIIVLYNHRHFDNKYEQEQEFSQELRSQLSAKQDDLDKQKQIKDNGRANNYDKVLMEMNSLKNQVDEIHNKHDKLETFRTADYNNLTLARFQYCKQSLASRALLVDNAIGGLGVKAFERMSITEFGIQFIDFVVKGVFSGPSTISS